MTEKRGKWAFRAVKRFTLFISNADMNDIVKIIKLLKDSHVLIDAVTETVKHETNHQKSFVSTFSCFVGATSNFFSSK